MQLDLKNVRVTYTLREVIAAVSMLLALAGHVVRTEIQHNSDQEQIVKLTAAVNTCSKEVEQLRQRASR